MDDRSFYERRLGEELKRAAREHDHRLKALHIQWAGLYAERLTKLHQDRSLAA